MSSRKEMKAEARRVREEREAAAAAAAIRTRRLSMLGIALAAAAAVVIVAIVISSGQGGKGPERKAGERVAGQASAAALFAGIPQNGITLGDPRAPITFVEFADLQCPFCRDYTRQVLPTLVTRYVRTGRMKMVFRNVAFIGTDSTIAGRVAAAAAMQDKLWPFIDIFYANQQEENTGYVTNAFLRRIGSGVSGLDMDRAMKDRDLPRAQRQLATALDEWHRANFNGTPSFLVGPTGGTLRPLDITSFNPGDFTAAIDRVRTG